MAGIIKMIGVNNVKDNLIFFLVDGNSNELGIAYCSERCTECIDKKGKLECVGCKEAGDIMINGYCLDCNNPLSFGYTNGSCQLNSFD